LITDASGYEGYADRVCAPRNEAELATLLGKEPVTIRGGGTGVTGGSVPQGGISLSLEHFNSLEIASGIARCGAGVLLKDLHSAAGRTGQFYPPDPTETWASVGGTIATNASGSRSFRYGPTRRWIRSLRVATVDGQIRTFRRGDPIDFPVPSLPVPNTTKHTAGYPLQPGMDWIDLFTGSEGTLGIILEAELTLLPVPEDLLSAVIFFPAGPPDTWRSIPGLRMLEYFDAESLRLLNAPGQSALLIEQDDPDLDAWEARIEGAVDSWFATSPADRERFRVFRHKLPELVNERVRRAGLTKMGSDFAVPVERNMEMLQIYQRGCQKEFPGRHVIFGHFGDGHLHVNLLPQTETDSKRAAALLTHFAREAVRLGGTVSAEHGLGKRKRHLLPLEYTEVEIEAMRAVKRRLDPNWLLGPGTLLTSSS